MKKEFKVGDRVSLKLKLTDDLVRRFAELTGDKNPIHLDDAYAQRSRFGRRVAHGMLVGSTLSRLAGMDLPGPGTIVMSLDMKYKAPCFVDDEIEASLEVVNIRSDKPIIKARYRVINQEGQALIEGHTMLFYEPID